MNRRSSEIIGMIKEKGLVDESERSKPYEQMGDQEKTVNLTYNFDGR
jgi:hypothetical protein